MRPAVATEPVQPPISDQPQPGVFWRIALMMALQWASLGIWVVTLPTYLAANTGDQGRRLFGESFIGDVGIASALGALLSPVVCGLLVDRLFSTEKVIAVLHALSGALLALLCFAESQTYFFLLIIAYFQVYAPTSALLSSLALRKLPDSARHFAQVRAAGTVGWIVVGMLVGLWPVAMGDSIEHTVTPMKLGVLCHLAAAVWSLRLPPTPPTDAGLRDRFAGSGSLWKNPKVALFLAISALAAAPSKFYEGFINKYLNYYDYSFPAFTQTMGQAWEVAVMLLVPVFVGRFSLKLLFMIGMACWIVRFLLLAVSGGSVYPWMAMVAISLHGFCFVFVFILGQLYIDRMAPRDSRGAAQGMHVLAVYGVGSLIGARLAGWAQSRWLTPEGVSPAPYHWEIFWLAPLAVSLLAAVLFMLLFSERAQE